MEVRELSWVGYFLPSGSLDPNLVARLGSKHLYPTPPSHLSTLPSLNAPAEGPQLCRHQKRYPKPVSQPATPQPLVQEPIAVARCLSLRLCKSLQETGVKLVGMSFLFTYLHLSQETAVLRPLEPLLYTHTCLRPFSVPLTEYRRLGDSRQVARSNRPSCPIIIWQTW